MITGHKKTTTIFISLIILLGCAKEQKKPDIKKIQKDQSLSILLENVFVFHKKGYQFDSIKRTNDNGYILTGKIKNSNTPVVIKLTADLKEAWEIKFNPRNTIKSSIQAESGEYIIAGNIDIGDKKEVWVTKLDQQGKIVFQKNFSIGKEGEKINSKILIQTEDNGYLVAGKIVYTDKEKEKVRSMMIKMDSKGKKQWEIIFRKNIIESINSVFETSDYRLILVGYIKAPMESKESDLVAIKSYYDKHFSMFRIEWFKKHGNINISEVGNKVIQRDEDYVIVGYDNKNSLSNIYIVIFDRGGNVKWAKSIKGEYSEKATTVIRSKDNGLLIGGYQYSDEEKDTDALLIKLDEHGAKKWIKILKVKKGSPDYIDSIYEVKTNEYIITGITDGDPFILKLDQDGNVISL